jgi:hypothetical protein
MNEYKKLEKETDVLKKRRDPQPLPSSSIVVKE